MNKYIIGLYKSNFNFTNKVVRFIWSILWFIFTRPFPRKSGNFLRLILLRIFGAKVHITCVIYSSVKVYLPWNLEMKQFSCLSPEVDCYNVDKIIIGEQVVISQKVFLCTASHNVNSNQFELLTQPIIIGDMAWIGASAFIGMGVTIGKGAVVGATASVYKNIDEWTIVGGNPAKFIKKRVLYG
jgi:putative colanic acid biosynthesis acetyltransferase WcaF